MFHTHLFKPSEKDPEMLYCHCGKIKDIHRHIWERHVDVFGERTTRPVGFILKCKICGEFKNHYT